MRTEIEKTPGRVWVRTAVALVATLGLAVAAGAQDAGHASGAGHEPGAAHAPGAAAVQQPGFKAHVLTKDELDGLLGTSQILVIDVRRPDELTAIGGLPVYLSIQVSELEKSLAWIPKGRSIITVSNHAKRAGVAADLLAAKGFKVAGAVGVQTYEEQGGKLTKIAAPVRKSAAAAHSASN